MKLMYKAEGCGSERRCTYFFMLTDGSIYVRCGCFSGTLDEFKKKIAKTHESEENRHYRNYMRLVKFIEEFEWE